MPGAHPRDFRVPPWLVLWVLAVAGCQRTDDPKAALARFYANDSPECAIKLPLVDGAPGTIPLVAEAIRDPGMPKRRYAIGFLGDVGASEAAGPLVAVVENGREQDYFRIDALVALQAVDPARAQQVAQKLGTEGGRLGEVSRDIAAGKIIGKRKSAWERFWERPCD